MKKKLLKYSLGPLGVTLISFVTLPLMAWFYSVEDIARFSLYQSIIILYALVFSFGLDQAFIREYFDFENKNKLLKNILFGVFVPVIVLMLLITAFFRNYLTFFLYDEYSFLVYSLTILSCFFSLLIRILSSIQRVKDEAVLYSLSQLSPKIIFLIILLIFTFTVSRDFENILIAQSVAIIFVNFIFVFINKYYLSNAFKERIDFTYIKKLYSFGMPLIFSGAIIWGLKLADRFYLKIFSDLYQLGLYSLAISIAGGVAIFSGIFNTIWSPMVYGWVEGGNIKRSETRDKINIISKKVSIFIFIITVVSILFSKFITSLFPQSYQEIYKIIPLCILSPLIYTLSEITGIGLNLMKKTKYTLLSCLGAIFFHLIISFSLIPSYGAIGAAISSVVAFYVFFILRSILSNFIWMKVDLYFVNSFVILSFLLSCCYLFLGGTL